MRCKDIMDDNEVVISKSDDPDRTKLGSPKSTPSLSSRDRGRYDVKHEMKCCMLWSSY